MTLAPGSDNQRLVTQVVLALGALALFALFALIVLPGILGEGRVEPTQPSGQKSAAASEGWLDRAEAPAEKGHEIPPIVPAEVLTPNLKLLIRGRTLFAKNCVPCHGPSGKGDGPSAESQNPRPRDFTVQTGWKNGFRVTDIFKTVTDGIKGTGMAGYDFMPPRDRMALVHAVRAFGTFDHGQEDAALIEALSAQFRTAGGQVPNRVPVSQAIAKLGSEFSAPRPLRAPAPGDPAVDVFRKAVADPARVAQALTASKGWRTDASALARVAVGGAPANGFRTSIATLPAEDWETLRVLLEKSLGEAPAP